MVLLVSSLVLIAMEPPVIIVYAITITIIGLIFYEDGWESGLIRVGYILVCLAIYLSTIYFTDKQEKIIWPSF